MRFSISILAFSLLAACSSTGQSPAAPEPKNLPQEDKGSQATGKTTDAPVPMAASAKTECTNKNDARTLEMRPKGKGCELAYTKNGQEAVVASSVNGTAHCDGTLNKIKERLQGAGFECK